MMKLRRGRFAVCAALGVALVAGACAEATAPEAKPDSYAAPQFAIPAGPYQAGQSYFGRNNYIEYLAGNAPVILTAPHGGNLTPGEIPDRKSSICGGSATTTTDLNTRELTLAMRQRFYERFGTYPHVVINHLHRKKLDANRPLLEAACNDAEAEIAWHEFHDFIEVAKGAAVASNGRGWYMDMHGHGHEIQRLELGYLLSGTQLRYSDATLDGSTVWQDSSSMKTLSEYATGVTFTQLLRGPSALGSLYADNGFPSVPGDVDPFPKSGEAYFSGGYNTDRHGCSITAGLLGGTSGGQICGVQIEANYTGVRDSESNRAAFAEASATVLQTFLATHWDIVIGSGGEPPPPPPPPPGITLTASAYKVKGFQHTDLSWSGATSTSVDVYRNGAVIVTTANDGAHTDALGVKGSGSYTYQVCEAGTVTCSNQVSVSF